MPPTIAQLFATTFAAPSRDPVARNDVEGLAEASKFVIASANHRSGFPLV
jgi:hypothetical protein